MHNSCRKSRMCEISVKPIIIWTTDSVARTRTVAQLTKKLDPMLYCIKMWGLCYVYLCAILQWNQHFDVKLLGAQIWGFHVSCRYILCVFCVGVIWTVTSSCLRNFDKHLPNYTVTLCRKSNFFCSSSQVKIKLALLGVLHWHRHHHHHHILDDDDDRRRRQQ